MARSDIQIITVDYTIDDIMKYLAKLKSSRRL